METDKGSKERIRLFCFNAEPDVIYPIHDHGAWGIIGPHISQIREKKFLRTAIAGRKTMPKSNNVPRRSFLPGEQRLCCR